MPWNWRDHRSGKIEFMPRGNGKCPPQKRSESVGDRSGDLSARLIRGSRRARARTRTTRSTNYCIAARNTGLALMDRWLQQNVRAYELPERVHADVEAVLARFPALRPKSDVYSQSSFSVPLSYSPATAYDDGRAQLLLCLHGLLPISFRGASYNIPIAIWITKDYPRRPPISYVVPTHDLLLRPGTHVDLSGRCDIPYARDWIRKPEVRPISPSLRLLIPFKPCSIAPLLHAMQDLFSRSPPLYAKPKSPPSSSPSSDRPPLPPKPIPSRPLAMPQVRPVFCLLVHHLPHSSLLSSLTRPLAPRPLLVPIPNPPNITDRPSNSLEILPLPSVLITAPQYLRPPCPIHPCQVPRLLPRALTPPSTLTHLPLPWYQLSLVPTCSKTMSLQHNPLPFLHRHAPQIQNSSNYMPRFTTRFDQSFLPSPTSSAQKQIDCVLTSRIFLPASLPSEMRWPESRP